MNLNEVEELNRTLARLFNDNEFWDAASEGAEDRAELTAYFLQTLGAIGLYLDELQERAVA